MVLIAALAYFAAPYGAPSGPVHAAACLLAALGVAAAGVVADGIWDGTAGPALGIGRTAPATLARYPFRLIGGGIAFTVVMLAGHRAEFFGVADVPVAAIFGTGAAMAAGYHLARDTRLRRWTSAPPGGRNQERSNR